MEIRLEENKMRNINNKLNHKGTITIITERLLLRKVRIEDVEDIYNKLATDEKIIDFLSWNDNPSIEFTKKMVNDIIKEYDTKNATYKWIIEELRTNKIIGMILVDSFNEERLVAELDYCISSDSRGKGYAPEALKKIIEYLIFEVGFFRIEAVHNLNNEASGKVMQKAGMKYEGTLRGRAISLNSKGYPDDLKMYAIIKTDL